MALDRRSFLKTALLASAACLAGPAKFCPAAGGPVFRQGLPGRKLSPFFEPLADKHVRCTLCPHGCEVGPGQRGACGVRENQDGQYYSLVYGNPCAVHLDPIEKKPFFHVLPASRSFSIATAGCNFHCKFCQNWEISQQRPEETINVALTPEEAAARAKSLGAESIASTYVEPTIFMEYMLDVGAAARRAGLLKVIHSNGFVNPEPLGQLMGVLDAACIDLKSAREEFYGQVCQGSLGPVKETLRRLVKAGVHTEIVHLMIPTLNDDPAETRELVAFVRDELSPEVPVHFTRFYPLYKLKNLTPTPVATLTRARETALQMGLKFAYVGNVAGHPGENTLCPDCQALLIGRVGYLIQEMNLKEGRCPRCQRPIPGIWTRPRAA